MGPGSIGAALRRIGEAAGRAAGIVAPRGHVLYHVGIVLLSAAIAASLPWVFASAARALLRSWALIADDKLFLVATEVGAGLSLIAVLSRARANWKNRRLARLARAAGLVHFVARSGGRASRRLKERQARMRDVMVIGATGCRTFGDPKGDLHRAVQTCRSARVMLVNPQAAGGPDREGLIQRVGYTVAVLGALRSPQRDIRVKLYSEAPLWKLTIIGDYAWVRHYHPGPDGHAAPEYVFAHGQDPADLFSAFYRYFMTRWRDPATPEYDWLGRELIYRDEDGRESRRQCLDPDPEPRGTPASIWTARTLARRLDSRGRP